MKKFLFPLLTVFALTVSTAAAQTTMPDANTMQDSDGRMQSSPDEMAKRQAGHLTKELGLTAGQTTKMQAILLARTQKMQALRGQARGGGNRGQLREQVPAGRAMYDAQFREVLTPDQYIKFTALHADRKERGGMHGGSDTDVNKMKVKTTDGDKIKVKADN